MKRVVHKSLLDWTSDVQEIDAPLGTKILHVALQHDTERPAVWFEREVGPYADNHPSKLLIQMVATGQEFEINRVDDAIHLGAIQVGWTVWHFYQVKQEI